jgi:transposase
VKRLNSSRSAPVLRSAGCNAFAKMGLANRCHVEGALPRWRNIAADLALNREQPDLTLEEIVAVLHKRRIRGSRSALSRFFARHGITVKKSLRAAV